MLPMGAGLGGLALDLPVCCLPSIPSSQRTRCGGYQCGCYQCNAGELRIVARPGPMGQCLITTLHVWGDPGNPQRKEHWGTHEWRDWQPTDWRQSCQIVYLPL